MKKNKTFSILVISIIAVIGITSCSQEENQTSNEANLIVERLPNAERDRLKAEFLTIMKSQEYTTFENNAKAMVTALNGADEQHLKTRPGFETWVTANIADTKFGSVGNAMRLYDALANSAKARYIKFQSFYDGLKSMDVSDVMVILEPEFFDPTLQITANDPHQEYCMDKCEQSMDKLESNYSKVLQLQPQDSISSVLASVYYWNVMQQIIDELNNCLNYI